MFRDLSLKLKLPIYLTAVFATVVLVLTVGAYSEVRRAHLDAAAERLRRVSLQLHDLTTLGVAVRLREADQLATTPAISELLRGRATDAVLRGASRSLAAASIDDLALAVDVRDRDGRRVLAMGDTLALPADGPAGSTPFDRLGPLLDVGGRVAYRVRAAVVEGPDTLGTVSVWRAIEVGEVARRVLADVVGLDAQFLFGSPGGAWTDLAGPVRAPPIDLSRGGPPATAALETYERGGSEAVYASVTRMDPAPWLLVVELPKDVVLAAVNTLLVRLALLAPLALLVVVAVAWGLGRAITLSLRETTVAAEAIAAGDAGHRLEVRGADEVGRLAVSFNAMAQQIEDSQRALHDLNASLMTMLDGAPLPIVAVDLEGHVRMWNRASERTFGWSMDEALGRLSPLADPGGSALRMPSGSEGPIGRECTGVRRDGRTIDLFVARAPTYAPSGRVDGYMFVYEDITARKEAEQQLARYAADLARSNAELENFAYVASHDLREPLRMVRSFTQLLADRYAGRLDDDADRCIHFAVDGATRMEGLIKGLLEYSRVNGDHGDSVSTDSERVLAEALVLMSAAIDEAGTAVTSDRLPTVTIDPDQLLRVFQNLIGNAIKFRGTEGSRVHVSAYREGDHHVFSVRDNGIGIGEEYFDRIFVIFKRLHGPKEFGGTGMGLSICKKIVERNGGQMWVESTPGAGSTFYFSLRAVAAMVA